MSGHFQHQLRRAGACFSQVQQRCAVMRPVTVSVWSKKTGTGALN
jgi:hypothetical protein